MAPAILLRVAGVKMAEIQRQTGINYAIVWKICQRPISKATPGESSRAVRRLVEEFLDVQIWEDLRG